MRALCAALLLGCAHQEAPPARREVDVPAWAESNPPAAKTIAVSTATTAIGDDEPKKPARGKKIDLDVVAADLANVCRLIGELAGVNIVVADGVSGTVTVKMRGVPWNEALDAILLSKGYSAEQVGSVIVIRGK